MDTKAVATLPKPLQTLVASVAELEAALKAKHSKGVITFALDEAEKAWKTAMKANLEASRLGDATHGEAYADSLNRANDIISWGKHASR